ncbi:TniB family NTP-binding protein [Streptomyces sp. NBC_01207]|uniref:TniB family NTP-binding protein n=1 Tax=Streptomyces sp. NBC_01207 TaxID=2903772 RepID=UPI002E0DBF1C|nr:ATP-binding protein [Streptomyces sp. NBC_01207]WSR20291.1 ATP-binding protein [Streptomyces sp. NBC_01207]
MNDATRQRTAPTPAGASLLPSGPFDPGPLTTKEGFRTQARRTSRPPDLQDCAPLGTKVTLSDPRLVYHGRLLPVETDDVAIAMNQARRLLLKNLTPGNGRGPNFVVDGPRLSGKSHLAALIALGFHALVEKSYGPDPDRYPVVYINVPHDRTDDLHWSLPFADFLGIEHSRSPETMNHRPVDMTEPVLRIMERARTRLVVVDGVEYIRSSERQTAFDYLLRLQDKLPGITFLFCGIGAREIVRTGYGDHRSQAPAAGTHGPRPHSGFPTLWVRPVPYTEADSEQWHRVLGKVEENLRLYKQEPGVLRNLAAYLHGRTDGSMHVLDQLICQAAQASILEGTEKIDKDLLDSILTGYDDPAY